MLCCVSGVADATRGSVGPSSGERATAPKASTTAHAERRCRKRTCNARATVLRSICAGHHHHTRRARAIPVTVASRAYRTGAHLPCGVSSQPATASRQLGWCVPETATRRTAAPMVPHINSLLSRLLHRCNSYSYCGVHRSRRPVASFCTHHLMAGGHSGRACSMSMDEQRCGRAGTLLDRGGW
jgi:hypothetical protein